MHILREIRYFKSQQLCTETTHDPPHPRLFTYCRTELKIDAVLTPNDSHKNNLCHTCSFIRNTCMHKPDEYTCYWGGQCLSFSTEKVL